MDKVVATGWGSVHYIGGDAKPAAVREKFLQARQQQPSIIIIEDLEFVLTASNMEYTICQELDKLTADHPVIYVRSRHTNTTYANIGGRWIIFLKYLLWRQLRMLAASLYL